jgi:hypothetical protein
MFIPIFFIYHLPYRPCGKEFKNEKRNWTSTRKEKKRNCYHNILSLESLFMLISISIVRSATFFCKKTMIFRAVCLKLKVAQTIS